VPRLEDHGPNETRVQAEQALKRVAERNEQLDAEDAQWTGEQPLATHSAATHPNR
jgi:hypothetical protein